MKKILNPIILLTICCSIMITSGCASDTQSSSAPVSDPDAGYEFAPIAEIRENFSQITNELREDEFVNLNFSNAEFSFPEIDSISELRLELFSGKSAREIYDFFCESLETLMPGKYSDEVKEYEIRFADGKRPEGSTGYYDFPTIKEYKLTDNPFPMFITEDCFMDMNWGVLRWFDNADLMRWCGEEGTPDMKTMFSDNTVFKYYVTDMDCTDKYELIDGEISIKDAAEFANNYLETMNFSPYDLSAKNKVVAVNVFDIGNGKYGYNFLTTPEYKNVLFDYAEMRGGGIGISRVDNDYDDRWLGELPGHVDMIKTDKVYHFISPAYNRSIEEAETYTSVITLENAAEIVSEFYSEHMSFYVERVQVVYLPVLNTAEPCWKFLMSCRGELYHTFVNMHTGEVHVYIQEP